MAFTFTVEDGSVVDGANSYATIAEADDYYAVDSNFFATWDALADADKEKLLAWGTRILDQRVRWNGSKTDTTSSLRWPRSGV